jgi:hypothetical protein
MLAIQPDVDIADFNPLFVIDGEGVKRAMKVASKSQPGANISPAAFDGKFTPGWQGIPLLL